MFQKGEIWAYPTDTSFGLGVRADDERGLEKLAKLKGRSAQKFFSLMVRNFDMLKEFAEVPRELNESFFLDTPKTALLKPKNTLPKSPYWPEDKVAFRISTIREVAERDIRNHDVPAFHYDSNRDVILYHAVVIGVQKASSSI